MGAPAVGGVAHRAFPLLERRVLVGGGAALEVHVIRDRELGEAAGGGQGRDGIDREVAVGRQVRVHVCVEREVQDLVNARGHLEARRMALIPR